MVNDDGVTPIASEPVAGGPPAGQAFELTAEWALWGRRATDARPRVLYCSAATLSGQDFEAVIERYGAGTADRLPQYTVFWVPGADGATGFVAAAIHEQIPAQPGARHDEFGGGSVVRLFCVRYADLAGHGVSYAQLLDAVQRQELPPRAGAAPGAAGPVAPLATTGPVTIHVTVRPEPQPVEGFADRLAAWVAALLLIPAQVCVLAAYDVPAADRLAFIDEVMSLLPYGLRATLSASTWGSSTAQELKLRLFFASATRDDGGRTRYVRWGLPGPAGVPDPGGEAARLYLDWLRRMGPRARSLLAGQTAPLRFTDADIRQMVAALPRDLTVADTLEDLAASLSDGDIGAARAEARRLEGRLDGPLDPADRAGYRRQIADQGLLGDHPGLPESTKARVYRVLLRLAFETPLSYDSYCAIEDAVGGPPRGTLRSELLKLNFASFLPWLLAARADPGTADEQLAETLAEQDVQATGPVTVFLRDVENMRLAHRAVMYDFAMRYLRAQAKDARPELIRRGYLADTLEVVFPGDQRAQRLRLEDTLRFVYGERLNRGQIRVLFNGRELRPTSAFEAAVTRLAGPGNAQFVAQQAAYARLRYAENGEESPRARRPRWRPRPPRGSPLS